MEHIEAPLPFDSSDTTIVGSTTPSNTKLNKNALTDITLLSRLAALLHDPGKACRAFQKSLISKDISRNTYRHEWVSLRLFQAFVGDASDDTEWLKRMAYPTEENDSRWTSKLQKDGTDAESPTPFEKMPPLAQAIGWLVVSHHRLPALPPLKDFNGFRASMLSRIPECITAEWNQTFKDAPFPLDDDYWTFDEGIPTTTDQWKDRASQLARELLNRPHLTRGIEWHVNPLVMHLARLSLMLADHIYSGGPSNTDYGTGEYPLFANTDPDTGKLKQQLDEHLLGVEAVCKQVVDALPEIATRLEGITNLILPEGSASNDRFKWQNTAAFVATEVRTKAGDTQGVFVVNMASTGSGKTLANAQIMHELADPTKGMRCAFALGLRTLTYQTGNEYRTRFNCDANTVAIKVGSTASMALSTYVSNEYEDAGSESMTPLLGEDGDILYPGSTPMTSVVDNILEDTNTRSLVLAPLLVCTIDQLIPATESTRGGHQIAPMLRLLSGDLVLDELDDYDISDLSAIARLVYWAGMLGSRVLISSATLPPALVRGMFDAYQNGRKEFQRNSGDETHGDEAPSIHCIWVDEFNSTAKEIPDIGSFNTAHGEFIGSRCDALDRKPVYRRGQLIEIGSNSDALGSSEADSGNLSTTFAQQILDNAIELHDAHNTTAHGSEKRVSFGLVRMANIGPLFDVAQAMLEEHMEIAEDYRIHLCVYHSQYPLLVRSAIEKRLDQALNRHDVNGVFNLQDIKEQLGFDESNHLFVVLSSPITEVGRDHDYDWAIVEPSSMRSIIQIAGRINRHREKPLDEEASANLRIFRQNWMSRGMDVEIPTNPAYWRPGFESREYLLNSHDLGNLGVETHLSRIDARPRIRARESLEPDSNFVDLEHARLERVLCPPIRQLTPRQEKAGASSVSLGANTWWKMSRGMLSSVLQAEQRFRRQSQTDRDLVLLPNNSSANKGNGYELHYKYDPKYVAGNRKSKRRSTKYVPVEASLNSPVGRQDVNDSISIWGTYDYGTLLKQCAAEHGISDEMSCAKRFGVISLPESEQGWKSDPVLGFTTYR